MHGVWSTWSEWTSCSSTCGNGTITHSRNCSTPLYGGDMCLNLDNKTKSMMENETKSCYTLCPGRTFDIDHKIIRILLYLKYF